MAKELYKRHRPKSLDAVLGQEGAVKSLQRMVDKNKIPHAILFSGPSGCGKTTIARILKKHLNCGNADFQEINAADFKGIDTVRDIRRAVNLAPIDGDCRLWLIDEAHKLTNDAQNSLLKLLEDNPDHAYFMLATTDPHKLIKTIITRCSEIKVKLLDDQEIEKIMARVIEKEKFKVGDDVLVKIREVSEGSARKALVILEQVADLDTAEEQLAAVQATSINAELAIALPRALINPGVQWAQVAAILKELKDEPEGIRYLVLSYARSVMLGGGRLADRAFIIIDVFSRNFYDSKAAGLAAACWEVVHSGRK